MKRQLMMRSPKLVSAIVIAGSAAAWAIGGVSGGQTAGQNVADPARMTEKMKTVCVGRFSLDFPDEARIEFSNPSIDGFTVVTFPETLDEFKGRLAEHEAQIKAKPDRLGGNRNMEVAKEVRGDGGMSGKLFAHSRAVQEGTASNGLTIEHYRYEGIAVEAFMHGDGVSVNLTSDFYLPDKVGNVLKLALKLVPNPENKVPTEPGFCMDGAYLRDPLSPDQLEQITMFARLPSKPDIRFLLILAAGLKPDKEGLIERHATTKSPFSLIESMRFSKLRAAPRTIGGIPGEEVVKRVHELNDAIVYSFWWEVPGTIDNIFVPHIVFQMDTGEGNHGPVPSSLSEGAAMGMWDRISSSIRVRPAQPKTSGPIEPPPISKTQTSWKLVDKRGRQRVPSPLPLAQATPVAAASITSEGTGPGGTATFSLPPRDDEEPG